MKPLNGFCFSLWLQVPALSFLSERLWCETIIWYKHFSPELALPLVFYHRNMNPKTHAYQGIENSTKHFSSEPNTIICLKNSKTPVQQQKAFLSEYQQSFSFKCCARLTFSSSSLPSTLPDESYFFIILYFYSQFRLSRICSSAGTKLHYH